MRLATNTDGPAVRHADDRPSRPRHEPAAHWALGHTSYMTRAGLRQLHLRASLGAYVYKKRGVNLGSIFRGEPGLALQLPASSCRQLYLSAGYLRDLIVGARRSCAK